MRGYRIAALVLSAVGLLAGVAVAQQGRSPVPAFFERLDADGDGRVLLTEARASVMQRALGTDYRAAQRFMRADLDGDGKLSVAEIQNRALIRAQRMMLRLDSDNDGFVSQQELAAGRSGFAARGTQMPTPRLDRLFKRLDADNDGVLTLEEAQTERQRL